MSSALIGRNNAHPRDAGNPELLRGLTRQVDDAPFAERTAVVDRNDDRLAGFEMRDENAAAERQVFMRGGQAVRVGPTARRVPARVRIEGRHAFLLEHLGFGGQRGALGFGRRAW